MASQEVGDHRTAPDRRGDRHRRGLQLADYRTKHDRVRPHLDVDGNGQADALTDGLMVIRYLFGLRGPSLIAEAIDTGATRLTSDGIEICIQSLMP